MELKGQDERMQKETCLKVRGRVEVPATAIVKRNIKFSEVLSMIKKHHFSVCFLGRRD
jgi:hypothetical protein